MRILLTNTLMLNGGEAATVVAIMQMLRRALGPRAEITVFEHAARAAAPLFPEIPIRQLLWERGSRAPRMRYVGPAIRRLNRARFLQGVECWCAGRAALARTLLSADEIADLERYASADFVVSSGGTYLVSNYDISPRLFDYELCRRLGRPLAFFTQSMGPFRPETRERLRRVLDDAVLILLRDETSLQHVRELGVTNRNVHLCGDAVFGMQVAPAGPRSASATRRPRVAFSVRNWHYFKTCSAEAGMSAYRAAMAAAATRLVRGGAEVVFISTCQGVPQYWFDDAAVARQIHALLPADVRPHAQVDSAFRKPDEMIAALRDFDMAVATRFHMAILAMLAGTPALAVSYEFKTQELYRGVGLDDWVDLIEPLPAEAFAGRVERCFRNREAAGPAFVRAVQQEAARALPAGELMRAAFAARSGANRPMEPSAVGSDGRAVLERVES